MRNGARATGPRSSRAHHAALLLIVTLAGAAFIGSPAVASALPPGDVIVASDTTTGQRVAMTAADGGGLGSIACGGDLTHGGPPRRFVRLERVGGRYPNGHDRTELVAFDESCGSRVQLTDDATLERVEARWSPDGRRLAYGATRFADGAETHGIFVRDEQTLPDGSVVGTERLAVALDTPHVIPSWSADSCRVTYGAPGAGGRSDVFVADLCGALPVTPTNLTATATIDEWHPAFSPATDEIAFAKRTNRSGSVRNDLFVIRVSAPSQLRQVTTKSNANALQIGHPSWSPDGTSIAFSGWLTSLAESDIYRIRADGRQKAANLTADSSNNYSVPLWRR